MYKIRIRNSEGKLKIAKYNVFKRYIYNKKIGNICKEKWEIIKGWDKIIAQG